LLSRAFGQFLFRLLLEKAPISMNKGGSVYRGNSEAKSAHQKVNLQAEKVVLSIKWHLSPKTPLLISRPPDVNVFNY
jgi:hypothetical protein